MKKYLFAVALMSLGLGFASCSDDDGGKSIPEGTSDVTIDEDTTTVNSSNIVSWTQYAVQVANLLTSDATTLRDAWLVDYVKNGVSTGAYAETFKNPSATNSTYKSYNECLQEIVEGCADIANEVGTSKIGEPRDLWESGKYTEAVYAVESWYSFHSRDDYSNNIRSIRNAFYGTRDGSQAEHSIASYLEVNNPTLYATIKADINNAIAAIEGISQPFRSHIGASNVLTAMDACAELNDVLTNKLDPYIIGVDDDEALGAIVNTYVDDVVIPTYKDLVDKNVALNTAVRALANNPSTETFKAAAAAWMDAREPWETSEAFLFGPVADLGLDPNMDSWPLDAVALTNKLKSNDFTDLKWEGEFNEDDPVISEAQNIRGFHTLEFLLFKNGEPRTYNK